MPAEASNKRPGTPSKPLWATDVTDSPLSSPKYPSNESNHQRSLSNPTVKPATGQSWRTISHDVLRSLYNKPSSGDPRKAVTRTNSSIIYSSVPLNFPPVRKLNPINKRRILVSGVCPLICPLAISGVNKDASNYFFHF